MVSAKADGGKQTDVYHDGFKGMGKEIKSQLTAANCFGWERKTPATEPIHIHHLVTLVT